MQEVIVIVDKYGYGGLKTVADVVAIPKGHTDLGTFAAWARSRATMLGMSEENVRSCHAWVACPVSELPKEII